MRMDLKLTTKGSGNSYKRSGLISGGLFATFGALVMISPVFIGFKEKGVLLLAFFGLIAFVWGLVELSVKRAHGDTYVEFYENYIQGLGIHGSTIDRFYFENNNIQSITVGNKSRYVKIIKIMTAGGEYQIITNRETADKVFSYVNAHFHG